jgi:hypothetical protein
MTIHTIGTLEGWLAAAALGAADWVCLAPAPTFAIMALLTGVLGGGQQDMFCSAAQYALLLGGMLWMYLLMSASHSAPWLKLISSRRTVPNDPNPTLAKSSSTQRLAPAARPQLIVPTRRPSQAGG